MASGINRLLAQNSGLLKLGSPFLSMLFQLGFEGSLESGVKFMARVEKQVAARIGRIIRSGGVREAQALPKAERMIGFGDINKRESL